MTPETVACFFGGISIGFLGIAIFKDWISRLVFVVAANVTCGLIIQKLWSLH